MSEAPMVHESVEEFYDRQYAIHRHDPGGCPNAVHDAGKAERRVTRVIGHFGIDLASAGASVLDVGSGLGYYTKALSLSGAEVVGLDFSAAAIAAATARFPGCRFRHGPWPDAIACEPAFDLIWMVNFSLMNTFDVEAINERVIVEAMARLKPGGHLVTGWNSNFSGRTIGGYSHWPTSMLRRLRERCRLSRPFVAEARTSWLSALMVRGARVSGRSIPFFMARQRGRDAATGS